MHVLLVEPAFPQNQRQFARALHMSGARVTGIGEAPIEALDSELHGWLDRYERQPDENPPLGLILCADKNEEQVELLELTDGAVRVADRVVPRGRLRESGEQGALGEREIGERFLEIEASGLGCSDAQVSVVEAVEVAGEDLLLAPTSFDAPGGGGFIKLVAEVSPGGR